MNRRAKEILGQLKERLQSLPDAHLISIICFGSYARGEETPESDLDVLVVVKRQDKAVETRIREQAYSIMWDYNFDPLLSVKIISEAELTHRQQLKTSFYESLQQEGIAL